MTTDRDGDTPLDNDDATVVDDAGRGTMVIGFFDDAGRSST